MGTLSQALGVAGPGRLVQWNGTPVTFHTGKTYTLTKTTKGIQAAFGSWLADRAEAAAFEMASKYRKQARSLYRQAKAVQEKSEDAKFSPAEEAKLAEEYSELTLEARALELEARNLMERFNDRKASGEFEFHGNVSIDMALANLPGQFQLCWLMLQPKHPELTLEEVIELHKGMLNDDGKPVKEEGTRITMMHVWRKNLLEAEGVKNEEADGKPSEASTETSTPTMNPETTP